MALTSAVAVLGGFKATAPATPSADATIDQVRFKSRILQVTGADGKLTVRLRVENTGAESAFLTAFQTTFVALPKNGGPTEPDEIDATSRYLQPGLPAEVTVAWRGFPSPGPPTVRFAFAKWTYQQGFSNDSFDWFPDDLKNDQPVAIVEAAVR
ncbi:hypothetical protein GCM10027589_30430 [Actinocorallia lasiicapitis]